MTTADAFAVNAAARPDDYRRLFNLPWIGLLEVSLAAAPAGPWVAWCSVDQLECLATVRLGRLTMAFCRDASDRPSRLAWVALAMALANVAGWTEGHWWRLY